METNPNLRNRNLVLPVILILGILVSLLLAGCVFPPAPPTPTPPSPSNHSTAGNTSGSHGADNTNASGTATNNSQDHSTPAQNVTDDWARAINSSSATTCRDTDCFITAANNCEARTMTVTDAVGTFTYLSSKNCVLTKTLVRLTGHERQEMKELLEGQSLTCDYKKGEFNEQWITSLLGGLESCNGELKVSLAKLVIFT